MNEELVRNENLTYPELRHLIAMERLIDGSPAKVCAAALSMAAKAERAGEPTPDFGSLLYHAERQVAGL